MTKNEGSNFDVTIDTCNGAEAVEVALNFMKRKVYHKRSH